MPCLGRTRVVVSLPTVSFIQASQKKSPAKGWGAFVFEDLKTFSAAETGGTSNGLTFSSKTVFILVKTILFSGPARHERRIVVDQGDDEGIVATAFLSQPCGLLQPRRRHSVFNSIPFASGFRRGDAGDSEPAKKKGRNVTVSVAAPGDVTIAEARALPTPSTERVERIEGCCHWTIP